MRLLWLLLFLFTSLPQELFAIDPGKVQGSFQLNDKVIVLTQAYAHLHDNAEGLLAWPKELRLLLVDREVPQEALVGIASLPVEQMAMEGNVQGLLLRLNPNDHKCLLVTLLYPPAEPGQTLMKTVSTTSQKPPIELKIGEFNRVSGTFEHHEERKLETKVMPRMDYSLRFSAPLFHEMPVSAVLVGQAAQNSPQMQALREKARALEKGDIASVQRHSTTGSNHRPRAFLAQTSPEAESLAKKTAAEIMVSIKRLQRVVERGDRSVAIFAGKQWHNFVRESGEWKSDD